MTDFQAIADALTARIGGDRVVLDRDVLGSYVRDQAAFVAVGTPFAAVRAQSMADVVATMQIATQHGAAVVARGSGTGLSGGANAIDGCIVLSGASMTRILEVDVVERTVRVECGVLNGDLVGAVAKHGLWYPPDPASRAISSIGGNIATNAGGGCCVKYGVTGDHVAGLVAVLIDGTVIRTGAATRKNVAGLDLTRLLTGSEGTLAFIVEATLRLRKLPAAPSTLVAFFPTVVSAGEAVSTIEAICEPSLLELMDNTTIRAVDSFAHMGLDAEAGALLIAQSDSRTGMDEIERCAEACSRTGATYTAHTSDPGETEQLLNARRLALPALERLGSTLLDDVAVPKRAIPEFLRRVTDVARRNDVVVATFGHAGDGNFHPTIVFDSTDTTSSAAARAAFHDLIEAALDLGGTITGEHGVGLLKQPFMLDMVGPAERALMSRIKNAFDPRNLLNPGKAF